MLLGAPSAWKRGVVFILLLALFGSLASWWLGVQSVEPRSADDDVPIKLEEQTGLATTFCPEQHIVRPNLVIVYDNSASMAFPLNMPDPIIKELYEAYNTQVQATAFLNVFKIGLDTPSVTQWVKHNLGNEMRRYGLPRAEVAKPIVHSIIERSNENAATSLVAFSGCDHLAILKGDGSPTSRLELQRLVTNFEPQGATAIARSLAAAGEIVDGTSQSRAGVIILLTDGIESCEGDPCATATAIKAAKPWSTIHVVKLGPESSSICVAQNSGGEVYQPTSVAELNDDLSRAQITSPFPLQCRK